MLTVVPLLLIRYCTESLSDNCSQESLNLSGEGRRCHRLVISQLQEKEEVSSPRLYLRRRKEVSSPRH